MDRDSLTDHQRCIPYEWVRVFKCRMFQHAVLGAVATRCNTLYRTATHCHALQHTSRHYNTFAIHREYGWWYIWIYDVRAKHTYTHKRTHTHAHTHTHIRHTHTHTHTPHKTSTTAAFFQVPTAAPQRQHPRCTVSPTWVGARLQPTVLGRTRRREQQAKSLRSPHWSTNGQVQARFGCTWGRAVCVWQVEICQWNKNKQTNNIAAFWQMSDTIRGTYGMNTWVQVDPALHLRSREPSDSKRKRKLSQHVRFSYGVPEVAGVFGRLRSVSETNTIAACSHILCPRSRVWLATQRRVWTSYTSIKTLLIAEGAPCTLGVANECSGTKEQYLQ